MEYLANQPHLFVVNWSYARRSFKFTRLNFFITVPADVLAPNGTRPSTIAMLRTNLNTFVYISVRYVIQGDGAELCDTRGVLRVKLYIFWGRTTPFFTPQPKFGSRGIVVIRRAGGRDHSTVTALTGAALIRSRSNLVGTNLGAGPRTSSFLGDVAR